MHWAAVVLIALYLILRFFEAMFLNVLWTLREPEPLIAFLAVCIALVLAHIHDENRAREEREMEMRFKYGDREHRCIRTAVRRISDGTAGGPGRNRDELVVSEEVRTERRLDR
jgi:hypothetical protein